MEEEISSTHQDRYGKLSLEQLFELYQLVLKEEHFTLDEHQKRFSFFLVFNSSLIAATVAGAMKADSLLGFVLLLVGPALIFYISLLGKKGTFRFYRRFIEVISIRAKLEQIMRFDEILPNPDHAVYWINEGLTPPRHKASREGCDTSEEFIEANAHKGYQAVAVRAFDFFIVISVCLFVGIAAMAYEHWLS